MQPLAEKGQIQIGEMVLVMVVVLFIAIGGIAFLIQRGDRQAVEALSEQNQKDHAGLARYISAMPALKYSIAGQEDLIAIDWRRALYFKELLEQDPYRQVYAERFTGYIVNIEPVYPPTDAYQNYPPPYNDPVFAKLELFNFATTDQTTKNYVPFVIPVLLHDPYTGRNAYALMSIVQVTS